MKRLTIIVLLILSIGCGPMYRVGCGPQALGNGITFHKETGETVVIGAGPSAWKGERHAQAFVILDGKYYPLVRTTTPDGAVLVSVGYQWERELNPEVYYTMDEYYWRLMQ